MFRAHSVNVREEETRAHHNVGPSGRWNAGERGSLRNQCGALSSTIALSNGARKI